MRSTVAHCPYSLADWLLAAGCWRLPPSSLSHTSTLPLPPSLPALALTLHRKWLLFVGGLLLSLAVYLQMLLPLAGSTHLYNPSIAIFGALTGVALAAAPLATVREVLRTKDASSFPGTLVLMQFLQFLSWTIYGWVVRDWSTFANNLVGVVLGGLQLCLIAYFGNKRHSGSSSSSSSSLASASSSTLEAEKANLVEGKEGKH